MSLNGRNNTLHRLAVASVNDQRYKYQMKYICQKLNPLSANITKWSNTLKQFVGKLPTNCLSVLDHFLELAFKGLKKAPKQVKTSATSCTSSLSTENPCSSVFDIFIYIVPSIALLTLFYCFERRYYSACFQPFFCPYNNRQTYFFPELF